MIHALWRHKENVNYNGPKVLEWNFKALYAGNGISNLTVSVKPLQG